MFKDCLVRIPGLVFFIVCCFFSVESYAETSAAPQIHFGNEPNWVTPTPPLTRSSLPESDISVRYLLSEQQINIADEGIAYFTRIKLQPIKEQGLEEVSEISFNFNPDFETMTLHEILVTRNGVISSRLNSQDIKIFKNETDLDKKQYGGRATALAILKDIRVGDIISYSYTTSGMNPILGKKRFGRFFTQWGVAVEMINLRLLTNSDDEVFFNQNGHQYKKVSENNLTEYLWQLKDVPAVQEEDHYPSWFNPYGIIEFSEYANWQQVNQWALGLYTDTSVSKELQKQITKWQSQFLTLDQQIEAAIQFVQDEVRYFGIEVGQNSHLPHSPADVFQQRYGDCKDKTMLLVTIFKQLGLNASPALVSSSAGRVLDDFLPSPGVFDHVIVYLDYNNKDYWVDGTISQQRGGLDKMGFVNYHRSLVVNAKTKHLTKINRPKERVSNINTEETFDFGSEDDTATLTVRTSYSGLKADSIRYRISTAGVKRMTENYLNFYHQFFTNIETESDIVIEDDVIENELVTLERYHLKDWTVQDAGKRLIETYAVGLKEYLVTPSVLKRKHPFAVSGGFELTHRQLIKLHNNKLLSFDPQKIEKRNDFFEYQKDAFQEDDAVVVTHHYKPLISYVEAGKTDDYMAKVKELKDSLGLRFVTLDKQSSSVSAQQNRLKALARKIINKD